MSVRTVERDLDALRQAGVPIWAEQGRKGGYTLDRERTLAPLALSPDEALAVAVALRSVETSPFAEAARTAVLKVLGTLPADVRRREEALAVRLHRVGPDPAAPATGRVVAEAVRTGRVLHLGYRDAAGRASERDVDPLGLLSGDDGWYLLAWCRLRDEVAVPRELDLARELARIEARPLVGE